MRARPPRIPVLVMAGTRPEVVKLAPVVHALHASRWLRPVVLATSQHQQLADPLWRAFSIPVDHALRVMRRRQTLGDLSARLLTRLGSWLQQHRVAAVLVQGDTTSALMGGLAAFYQGVPVGHVEAGLRTGDLAAPFPEELNRRLLATLARWHFAPTPAAARHLKREGVAAASIHLTGNTVVDALRWMRPRCRRTDVSRILGPQNLGRPLVVVTCHRRESLGPRLRSIAQAVARVARSHPDVIFLLPLHPNPAVREILRPRLRGLPNVRLTEPLGYREFLSCLMRARLILTDSGGVQEEATALGKPVLVLRDQTERPEGVTAGALHLVGTEAGRIAWECARFLRRPPAGPCNGPTSTVFGDGRAARRIVRILEGALSPARRRRMQ